MTGSNRNHSLFSAHCSDLDQQTFRSLHMHMSNICWKMFELFERCNNSINTQWLCHVCARHQVTSGSRSGNRPRVGRSTWTNDGLDRHWWTMQHPNLPTSVNWLHIEHPHAGLTGSWLIHKRYASQHIGLVAVSPTLHKWWRRSLRIASKTKRLCRITAACFTLPITLKKTFCSGWNNTSYRCHESHSQLNNIPHNWHADSSRRSIVHLSKERTAPRHLEPNLSQTLHSF